MLRQTLATLAVGALCAAPTTASANPGTFLITEAQAGYALGSAFAESPDGFATKLTLGVGGKFVDFPTRFYGIFNLTWAGYDGTIASGLSQSETEREWFAWSLGLRTLTPLAPRLRLLVDAALGSASVESTAILDRGRDVRRAADDSLVLEMGVGLQYRVHYHLSLGARADLAIPFNFESFDVVSELAGARSGDAGAVNPSFLATITVHL